MKLAPFHIYFLVFVVLICMVLSVHAQTGDVTLAWDKPTSGGSVVGYNLYYKIGSQAEKSVKIQSPNQLAYTFTTGFFQYGATVVFQATAYNSVGEGPRSNAVQWTKKDILPGAVLNLKAT